MLLNMRDEEGVGQANVVQTEAVSLVVNLFEVHRSIDVFRSSGGRRIVDLVSEQVE
jgi:hypothetical protein